MTKSVKVKIILIITFLTLSALIITYKYFTEFKQTQIDREEQEAQNVSWDSPINQFEFADPQETKTKEEQTQGSISKIDLNQKAFVKFQYSTQPFINASNAKELAQKIAFYGKDPVIQNFIRDMKVATGHEGEHFDALPSVEEIRKQMASTQTQKILLQYSKDPAFRKAVQRIMQDPAFMTGFINYINQPEQKESSK